MDSRARFEQTFTGLASAVQARIWQQVYGPEYPAWADPFSYISVTELRQFTHKLHAAPGQCLVDAGCGHGGPGLWVAAATGARLIGIDPAEAALAAARRRADQAGMASQASFRQGTFADTGLPGGSAQAVMSIDALLFAPSMPAAAELAWRDRQQRTGQALLAAAAELAAESGSTAAQQRARITEMNANTATITRRVLVTAQRRTGDELPVAATSQFVDGTLTRETLGARDGEVRNHRLRRPGGLRPNRPSRPGRGACL